MIRAIAPVAVLAFVVICLAGSMMVQNFIVSDQRDTIDRCLSALDKQRDVIDFQGKVIENQDRVIRARSP